MKCLVQKTCQREARKLRKCSTLPCWTHQLIETALSKTKKAKNKLHWVPIRQQQTGEAEKENRKTAARIQSRRRRRRKRLSIQMNFLFMFKLSLTVSNLLLLLLSNPLCSICWFLFYFPFSPSSFFYLLPPNSYSYSIL